MPTYPIPQTYLDHMANYMARRWPQLNQAQPMIFCAHFRSVTPDVVAKEFELNDKAGYASWPPSDKNFDYFLEVAKELEKQACSNPASSTVKP